MLVQLGGGGVLGGNLPCADRRPSGDSGEITLKSTGRSLIYPLNYGSACQRPWPVPGSDESASPKRTARPLQRGRLQCLNKNGRPWP